MMSKDRRLLSVRFLSDEYIRPVVEWVVLKQKWLRLFLGGIVLLLLIIGAVVAWRCNDRTDNPALLISVTDDGEATLQTYRGIVRGKFARVDWHVTEDFLGPARVLIANAQSEFVQWGSDDEGIEIWYDTSGGLRSLNKELQELSRAGR